MMNKVLLSVFSLLVVGIVIIALLDNQAAEVLEVQADTSAIIYARKVNETLYQHPVTQAGSIHLMEGSLSGTDVVQDFKVDEKSNLVPDQAIVDMFEYFLSTTGENKLEDVIGAIQLEIQSQLNEPARSQALSLLKRYIDYKIGIEEFQQGFSAQMAGSEIEHLQAMQTELKAYRESYFDGDEYEALFKLEEVQNTYLIEQMRINADKSLTMDEKQYQLELANLNLPEEVRATRQRAQQHIEIAEQVKALKENSASDSEVYRLREKALGIEAASALADLDQQRIQWKQRLNEFSTQRNSVLASSLSDTDKNNSISGLLVQHFRATEIKRVNALINDGRL